MERERKKNAPPKNKESQMTREYIPKNTSFSANTLTDVTQKYFQGKTYL